jgi:hypothetical protein
MAWLVSMPEFAFNPGIFQGKQQKITSPRLIRKRFIPAAGN